MFPAAEQPPDEPGAPPEEPGAPPGEPGAPLAAPPGGRGSERGAATRSGLLAAAREVFIHRGYAQAGVTEIVTTAGASVGSLYHHFAGKGDLYLALYDQLLGDHNERTRQAVRDAKEAGVTDPMLLFLAGARAYLDVSIEQRDLAGVFARGDGPPGFELVWQQRLMEWVSKNTEFFARSGEPMQDGVGVVVTGALLLAVAEVCRADDAARARELADNVIRVLSRLEARS
jgi:AcrR family transcriptional regulator